MEFGGGELLPHAWSNEKNAIECIMGNVGSSVQGNLRQDISSSAMLILHSFSNLAFASPFNLKQREELLCTRSVTGKYNKY